MHVDDALGLDTTLQTFNEHYAQGEVSEVLLHQLSESEHLYCLRDGGMLLGESPIFPALSRLEPLGVIGGGSCISHVGVGVQVIVEFVVMQWLLSVSYEWSGSKC